MDRDGGSSRGGAGEADGGGAPTYMNRVALASLSAAAAETATFPIDIIKTRLQLQGQPRHGHHLPRPSATAGSAAVDPRKNAFRMALDIWRGEVSGPAGLRGLLGFYRGLSPAILRHLFYTPIRIVGYEHLRNSGVASPADSLFGKAFAGGLSGVMAQIIASPADLIKVRMQADGRLVSQGLEPRYLGIFDAFRKITRTEGIAGLWKGVLPNAQRAFLVNMGELACYDYAKHFIITNRISGDNIYTHTLASITSGLSATTLSCPADVVKTRMMNQAVGKQAKTLYRNTFDCFVKTIRFEGITALWKGFFPTWARLGPWQFVFWVSYEKLRHMSGLSSF